MSSPAFQLQNVELLHCPGRWDVEIAEGQVCGVRSHGQAFAAGTVQNGDGGLLLPGLHDHHLHLFSLAAALDSLRCGPPEIETAGQLAALLAEHNDTLGTGWVRGIGYHPAVAGDIDRDWLDEHMPHRPVRIQHRGGRLWVFNSEGLRRLAPSPGTDSPAGLEKRHGRYTGRLFEGDTWLRERLGKRLPDLARASARLACAGVTGITDTTPSNDALAAGAFRAAQRDGRLLQRVRMMGSLGLSPDDGDELWQPGEYKVHLLESDLPDFDRLCQEMRVAHESDRSVAVHCVTLTELVFALAALEQAGVRRGDRIEHASVAPPEQLDRLAAMGLRVVTQPHFIAERGDQYLRDVAPPDRPWLYRGRAFLEAGVPLAAGSDAPFGQPDPWASMRAAVNRCTSSGQVLSADECLTSIEALSLYLGSAETPGIEPRLVEPGAPADLCLLSVSRERALAELNCDNVRATWVGGRPVFGSVREN